MKKRIIGIILIMCLMISNLAYAKVTIEIGGGNTTNSSSSTKETTKHNTNTKETTASKQTTQNQIASSVNSSVQKNAELQAQQEALALQQAILQQQIAMQQAQLEAMNQQYINENLQAHVDGNGIKRGWEYSQLLKSWIYYDMLGNLVKDNWVEYNNQKYYFNLDGTMVTGWKKIGSKWYYFNKNGDMHLGWLQEGSDWYYLSPLDGGAMQVGDIMIDGEFHLFLASGKWVDNIESHENNELATIVVAMTNYVNDNKKLKVVKPDKETKENVETIIKNLPRDVLQRIVESVKAIYICMEDADGYITEESYKDEDNTSQRVQLPYYYQGHNIYVCGDVRNLYSGIGLFIARTYMISDRKIWNTKTWKQLYEDTEERDNAYSLSFNTYRVYPETQEQCLATLIGYYMIDRWDLQETCPSYYKYIATYCNIGGGYKSPLAEGLN